MIRRLFELMGPRTRPRWQIAAVFAWSAAIGVIEAWQLAAIGYDDWFYLPLCIAAAMAVPAVFYPLWK